MEVFVILMTALQIIAFLVFTRTVQKEMQKQKQESAQSKEKQVFALYQNIEQLMDTFEEYIGEIREEMDREHAALAELSRQAATLYRQTLESPSVPLPAPAAPPAAAAQEPKPVPPADVPRVVRPETGELANKASRLSAKDRETMERFATKPQRVRFLMSRGLSIEEVARELSIGKGEVRLISGLEK